MFQGAYISVHGSHIHLKHIIFSGHSKMLMQFFVAVFCVLFYMCACFYLCMCVPDAYVHTHVKMYVCTYLHHTVVAFVSECMNFPNSQTFLICISILIALPLVAVSCSSEGYLYLLLRFALHGVHL